MGCDVDEELAFRVVKLILEGEIKKALDLLSEYYGIKPPRFVVKRPKGIGKALAVYMPRKETIYFTKGEYIYNPFIVLHEFYHHLRFFGGKHRGTEKGADSFAMCFLEKYRRHAFKKFF